MKSPWRWGAAGFAVALAGYFFWCAARALDVSALMELASSPGLLAIVVIAAFLYALIIPITAWAWMVLLCRQGEAWRSASLARILGLTQLAKYVPGNVAQHATRAALSIRAGMGTRALLASVTQETVLAVAASLIVGISLLLLSPSGLARLSAPWLEWLSWVGILLGAVVLLLASVELRPELLRSHSSRILRLLGGSGGLPGPAATFSALGAYIANYLVIGLGLWLVARVAGFPEELDYNLATAAFALSWALGFLTPGAPAGLGAREGVMLLILQGVVPDDALVTFAVLARFVTMLGDLLCFLFASLARMDGGRHGGVA